MAARLTDTLRSWHTSETDIERVTRAYWLALDQRRPRLAEHHPALLHPARSVLILFHDVNVREARVLSAAAVLDTSAPELEPDGSAIEARLGRDVAELVAAVPRPAEAGSELLEQLVIAEREIQLIALAERLDYARHLHLIRDEGWQQEHALVRDVYLPIALRTDAVLGRRFAWWVDAFGRRRLRL
jgi:(p)ppGpp synthase/HD superfamily hydrolase